MIAPPVLLALLIAVPADVCAQPSFLARLVQEGLVHSEAGRYSEAINALEEAWELDPSDPTVAEHLGLAYLYEKRPPSVAAIEQAEELMRTSLALGGQATVHARHLHGGLQWLTNMDDSCPGRWVISRRGVDFIAEDGHHSFSLAAGQILALELPESKSSRYDGLFRLEAADESKYRIRTGTETRSEARIVVQLIREFTLGG